MMFLGNFAKIPFFYANSFKFIDIIVWIFKNYCTFASSDSNNAHTYESDKFNNLIFIHMKTYSELIQYCEKHNLQYEVNTWYEKTDSIYFEDGKIEMGTYFGICNLANRSGKSEWNWTWFKSYDKKDELHEDSHFNFVERYSMVNGKSYTGVKEMMKAYMIISEGLAA